jgi:CheY-like chemotaxis protein
MPDEDGYQLMRKIRALATDPLLSTPDSSLITHHSLLNTAQSIPAIALTGYATAKDRERALAAGYQLHLAKPVEPEALVAAILSLLRGNSKGVNRKS